MTLTPGLLDQRLRFFARTENGADGFARPVYSFTGEYWGRIDATADNQTIAQSPQAHMDTRTTLTATVAEYVPIDPFGLVKILGGDALFFVRGVVRIRHLRSVRVSLDAIDPTEFATFELYEGEDTLDGYHLVLPA